MSLFDPFRNFGPTCGSDPLQTFCINPKFSEAADIDYYAAFINALQGLIDDAERSNYDEDGTEHLREALEFFRSDYRILNSQEPEGSSS